MAGAHRVAVGRRFVWGNELSTMIADFAARLQECTEGLCVGIK